MASKNVGKAAIKKKVDPPQPNFCQQFWKSPITMVVVATLTLLLVAGAVAMVCLSFEEEKKHESDRKGMVLLRDFVIGNNESLKGKTDKEIIQAAYDFMKELTVIRDRNERLQNITLSVSKDQEWEPFGGRLYHFSKERVFGYYFREYCARRNATSVSVHSKELQVYLEEKVKKRNSSHWVGMHSTDGIKFFWDDKEGGRIWMPIYHKPNATCGVIQRDCESYQKRYNFTYNCFLYEHCNLQNHAMCVKKRDPQWMF